MDATSLAIAVAKELYVYYSAVKHCDDDIKQFRAQLLSLQATSDAVTTTLQRASVSAESQTLLEPALKRCAEAANELLFAADKIKKDEPNLPAALAKLRVLGRKAVYPFKKETVSSLAANVKDCRDALEIAVNILGINLSASLAELVQKVDDNIVNEIKTLEGGLQDLKVASQSATDAVSESVQRQTRLIIDEADKKRAEAVVNSLWYSELDDRRHDIPEAGDSTLASFLALQDQHDAVRRFLTFLDTKSGLFWISGEPASGKSCFMKLLADPHHAKILMKSWTTTKSTVIASHYFWIAGRAIQKSRQGMLQSLLFQLLQADLTLVPRVCERRWSSRLSSSSWSVQELWHCLQQAVGMTERNVSFFVDGLDECQPESEHPTLATMMNKLSCFSNVKLVVSSRPWSVFKSAFEANEHYLAYESINHSGIAAHFRERMEAFRPQHSPFDLVDWACATSHADSDSWGDVHPDCEAQDFVCRAIALSGGNFLWLTLVLDAICSHISAGLSLRVLRKCVDSFPRKLEQYFRNLVFDRIHDSCLSETAFVLKMATEILRFRGSGFIELRLIDIWLIRECFETGNVSLANPCFLSETSWETVGVTDAHAALQETKGFLANCCKDIFRLPEVHAIGECQQPAMSQRINKGHSSDRSRSTAFCQHGFDIFCRIPVELCHRTVYDFLRTPEMQALLDKHTPPHFRSSDMKYYMTMARWKIKFPEVARVAAAHRCFDDAFRVMCQLRRDNRVSHEQASVDVTEQTEVLLQVEDLVLSHLHVIMPEVQSANDARDPDLCELRRYLRQICLSMATNGRYALAEIVLEKVPFVFLDSRMSSHIPSEFALAVGDVYPEDPLVFDLPDIGMQVNSVLLDMLLEKGADMNVPHWRPRRYYATAWRSFLKRLSKNERRGSGRESDEWQARHRRSGNYARYSEFFADVHIQHTIMKLICHGADLRPCMDPDLEGDKDPLRTLQEYLPRDSELYDWTRILQRLEEREGVRRRLYGTPHGRLKRSFSLGSLLPTLARLSTSDRAQRPASVEISDRKPLLR